MPGKPEVSDLDNGILSFQKTEECIDKLTSRSAIITCSTSCIGRATAPLISQEGADLIFAGRMQTLGRQLAGEIRLDGGRCIFLQANQILMVDGDITAA